MRKGACGVLGSLCIDGVGLRNQPGGRRLLATSLEYNRRFRSGRGRRPLVPTLCVGTPLATLRVALAPPTEQSCPRRWGGATRSVAGRVPTQSVGTRGGGPFSPSPARGPPPGFSPPRGGPRSPPAPGLLGGRPPAAFPRRPGLG